MPRPPVYPNELRICVLYPAIYSMHLTRSRALSRNRATAVIEQLPMIKNFVDQLSQIEFLHIIGEALIDLKNYGRPRL